MERDGHGGEPAPGERTQHHRQHSGSFEPSHVVLAVLVPAPDAGVFHELHRRQPPHGGTYRPSDLSYLANQSGFRALRVIAKVELAPRRSQDLDSPDVRDDLLILRRSLADLLLREPPHHVAERAVALLESV